MEWSLYGRNRWNKSGHLDSHHVDTTKMLLGFEESSTPVLTGATVILPPAAILRGGVLVLVCMSCVPQLGPKLITTDLSFEVK